ncbi:M20 metallopeptidase family protein [Numidum massiliense]|uniref:M20 metallopeptidase family protein n=1 Tax=Numidum massiliense TaxID=1522315 RepID=UPI0006D56820|nr:M20 family metallopeptidase [Numidum massiliense]
MDFKGKGARVREFVTSVRRDLHRHPELGGAERRTSGRVQTFLREWGIDVYTGFAGTGVLGVINPESDGPCVALRADMDALPIQEKNAYDFVSTVPGTMHACGHDAHTAMLLGAAKLLQAEADALPGKVLLVFQPAEEVSPHGGAGPMMQDGVFQAYRPDAVFGQHVWPDLPVGEVGVVSGPIMGASDRFRIVVSGQGGHASMPHQGVDAIVIANQLLQAIQTIVSRNVSPQEAAVVTVGRMSGGVRYNVIAAEVEIEGTVRTFRPEVKQMVKQRLSDIAERVVQAMGGTVAFDYWDGYPATVNRAAETETVRGAALHILGEGGLPDVQPALAGEDFSRFLERYSGAFYWLGCGSPDPLLNKPLHDAEFHLDEACLPLGAELLAQVAANFMRERRDRQ